MFEHDDDDPFRDFLEENLITAVIRVVKSGKEGTVYCCQASDRVRHELLAIKVYRAREHRQFHNDAIYQEGRWIGDRRLQRAVANKSRTGREFQAGTWVGQEWETLTRLHRAGAAVPEPISRSGQAILMEFVGTEEEPASLLQHADIPTAAADGLFRNLLREIELWLSYDRVHGDLSPFNILYWRGRTTVIDFPQAVDPEENRNARDLLLRDIANVCRYFSRLGIRADPEAIAHGMWGRYLASRELQRLNLKW